MPLRDQLVQLGYKVDHRVVEGAHLPQGWQEALLPAWLSLRSGRGAAGKKSPFSFGLASGGGRLLGV